MLYRKITPNDNSNGLKKISTFNSNTQNIYSISGIKFKEYDSIKYISSRYISNNGIYALEDSCSEYSYSDPVYSISDIIHCPSIYFLSKIAVCIRRLSN